MAQAPVQSTWISLFEARELVTRQYLSPALAGKQLIEQIAAEKIPWRHEHIKNNSEVPTEIALHEFWRPVGLAINWEESSAARRIEPRKAVLAPAGMQVRYPRPTRSLSQLGSGHNFFVYGIRLSRAGVERWLEETDSTLSLPPSGTKRWIYEFMKHHPDANAQDVWDNRPDDAAGIKRKTVQNQVSEYRKGLRESSQKFPKSSRKR